MRVLKLGQRVEAESKEMVEKDQLSLKGYLRAEIIQPMYELFDGTPESMETQGLKLLGELSKHNERFESILF